MKSKKNKKKHLDPSERPGPSILPEVRGRAMKGQVDWSLQMKLLEHPVLCPKK